MFTLLLILALLPAFGASAQPQTNASNSATNGTRTFQVKGTVIEVLTAEKEVRIRHDAIPGYMPAMTMPFPVHNTNELSGLAPGQVVSFKLLVTPDEGWIEQISPLGMTNTTRPANATVRIAREVEPLGLGDPLPNYHLTNQFGAALSTSTYRGAPMALTFLFTRCPFPNFCPLMANQFEQVQQKLESAQGGPTNWQLLTVSFDPAFDTPAVLKAYAESHHYDPKHWTFATGSIETITELTEQLGLAFWHDQGGGINHNLRTALFDASGRLKKVYEGNQWTSDELAADIREAASPP